MAALTVALTVVSQIGLMRDSSTFLVLWAALALLGICGNARALVLRRPQVVTLLVLCAAGVYSCLAALLSGELGYTTGFFMLLVKSVMVYFAGWTIAPFFSGWRERLGLISVYAVAAFAYTLWAVYTYVPSISGWLGSMTYLYSSKNSYGQIAGVALLAMEHVLLARKLRKPWSVVAACTVAVAMSAGMVLLQCRTAILAALVASTILVSREKGSIRLVVVLVACACLYLYLFVPSLRQMVNHAAFIDKYAGAGLDAFSSGRLHIWASAWTEFLDHPAFGMGTFYVDNLYINCLTNVGLVGASIYLPFLAYRVVLIGRSANMRSEKSSLSSLMVALAAFYFVESLLEGQPPLGPGASSFFFWLLCGIEDAGPMLGGTGDCADGTPSGARNG